MEYRPPLVSCDRGQQPVLALWAEAVGAVGLGAGGAGVDEAARMESAPI